MSSRTIEVIQSEIEALKNANPHWLTDAGVKALITALINEKVAKMQSQCTLNIIIECIVFQLNISFNF